MDQNQSKNDMRCPVCLAEFNQRALAMAGVKNCPHCKTTIQPLEIKHDGYIHTNWQDMRVLAIYARRWAAMWDMTKQGNRDAVRALENILNSLRKYQPKDAPPLVPQNEVIVVGQLNLRPDNPIVDMGEVDLSLLKPDPKTGLIPSPFYRKLP